LFIDFPPTSQELEIVRLKVPEISARLAEELVRFIHRVRQLDLKKVPSISETLDWARALALLNADALDEQVVQDTLNAVLKYEGDIRKAQEELKDYLARRQAEQRDRPPDGDKDLLH
jgi:MoxR-like ATPase